VAAPTRSGFVPNALVIRTRTRSPPAVTLTTLRTVWSSRPLSAGQAAPAIVPPPTGLPCQALTHRFDAPAAGRLTALPVVVAVVVAADVSAAGADATTGSAVLEGSAAAPVAVDRASGSPSAAAASP